MWPERTLPFLPILRPDLDQMRPLRTAVYLVQHRGLPRLPAIPTFLPMAPRKKKPAPKTPDLQLRGLSYSDWEDEAAQLRQSVNALAPERKRAIKRAQQMLAGIDAELEAMASVDVTLGGFDAIRLGLVRDLLLALRANLLETLKRLSEGGRRPSQRKTPTPVE
jgi:hypothetical protein